MGKYERKCMLSESIPGFINDFELSLLLFEFKVAFYKLHDSVKFKDLDNHFCLTVILDKFYTFSPTHQQFLIKKILGKISNNAIYLFYIQMTCHLLIEKRYDELGKTLKSFVATGLIKNAEVSDDKVIIKIILPDNTEIKYSHIQEEKELLDEYRGECHNVTLYFLKNCENANGAAVVLEDRELFGKYYHSFLLENGIMFDLAHNIMMKYEDYLKLINPTVLILEDRNTILNNIKELENNKSFVDSEYSDILKYAISKQVK